MGAITEATDQELEAYRAAIVAEQERRRTITQAATQIDAVARSALSAMGVKEGDGWVQPTDASNAYPKGWTLTHNGKTWISLISGNVWEPGISGWREEVEEGGVPDFIQPTGAHDAYHTGDHVMFNGVEYVSTIDNNVWSPEAYPAGWERV